MSAPTPYLHLPGTARAALTFYGRVFGCEVELHTLEEFGRTDGPPDAIAHGQLVGGPVSLYVADAEPGDTPLLRGVMLALLGTAPSGTLRAWFAALAERGDVVDDLQRRPWGAWDGQVVDAFGVHWLIGFEVDAEA